LVIVAVMWAPRRIVGPVTLLLIVALPAAVDAKLAAAPFELEVTPNVVTEGEQIAITLRPVNANDVAAVAEPYDIYLSLIADGTRRWVFMASSGQISPAPAPFRASIRPAAIEPLTATVHGLSPGWCIVRAQFVKSSAPEPGRKHYILQPV